MMTPFVTIPDIHTHDPLRPLAILNVSPDNFAPEAGKAYSVGIHPWDSKSDISDSLLSQLKETAANGQVAALGETGLDKLRGAPLDTQERLLTAHIVLSETLGKPLLLHIVKAADIVLDLHKRLHPKQTWVWHGFRGNAALATQLTAKGICLSIGEKYNDEAVKAIPETMLFVESDDCSVDLQQLVARLAALRGTNPARLAAAIVENVSRVFHLPALQRP